MPVSWHRFLCVRVPLVLLAILMSAQACSLALRRIPLRRSYMDDLALAVQNDHAPHRVVLLGDSITLISTRRYQLGRGPQDVANLATIAWTGAAAELFLLQRYLENHPAPQYVVYASAADDLQNSDSPQLLHYYDWNVYDRPEEHAFLRQYVPGIDARERLPAALDIQETIVERLTSLVRRSPPFLIAGDHAPDPNVATEPAVENRMDGVVQDQRMRKSPRLGALEAAVFRRMCALSQRYGFRVEIAWPPLPQPVLQAWHGSGQLERLDAQLLDIFSHDCNIAPTFDANSERKYTNFNRDGFHLHGPGWEERYAADLSRDIAMLPDRDSKAAGAF